MSDLLAFATRGVSWRLHGFVARHVSQRVYGVPIPGHPEIRGPQGPVGAQGPGVIVTDGNGNRAPDVVTYDAINLLVWREVGGYLWSYWLDGDLTEQFGGALFLGTSCVGQPYAIYLSGDPDNRQMVRSTSLSAFGVMDPAGTPVSPAQDDSVVYWQGSSDGCSTPQSWVADARILRPLIPVAAPSNLTGPLDISAQN